MVPSEHTRSHVRCRHPDLAGCPRRIICAHVLCGSRHLVRPGRLLHRPGDAFGGPLARRQQAAGKGRKPAVRTGGGEGGKWCRSQ